MYIKTLIWLVLFTSCTHSKTSTMTAQTLPPSEQKKCIRPAYLKKGDRVAIVAPAGILKGRQAAIEKAQELLESWGLVPVLGPNLFTQKNHFAGEDAERLSDLQWALDDTDIRAIWCARGGYGSMRIVDDLDFEGFQKSPKWLIGYSDITVLHNKLQALGYETIHGMMAVNMEDDIERITTSIETLEASLFGTLSSYSIAPHKLNQKGKTKGVLVGGNLTLLTAQLGSSTQLNTQGTLLFIEEIGEYKYHIDRMLQSLERAGYFKHCSGVLVGDMTEIKANTTPWGSSVEQLIVDVLKAYDFPIAFGIPSGHELENRALIFGRNITLNISPSETKINFE